MNRYRCVTCGFVFADGSYISRVGPLFLYRYKMDPAHGLLYHLHCSTYENVEVSIQLTVAVPQSRDKGVSLHRRGIEWNGNVNFAS